MGCGSMFNSYQRSPQVYVLCRSCSSRAVPGSSHGREAVMLGTAPGLNRMQLMETSQVLARQILMSQLL